MNGSADHGLDERDGVARHLLEADGTVDVGGAAVSSPVEPVEVEAVGKAIEVDVEGAGVGAAGVQEHERIARPVLVPPVLRSPSRV